MASFRYGDPKGAEHPDSCERQRREEESLDKTIEDSFPASDPPSTIPDPGNRDENAA